MTFFWKTLKISWRPLHDITVYKPVWCIYLTVWWGFDIRLSLLTGIVRLPRFCIEKQRKDAYMGHIQLLLFALDCSVTFRHLDTTTQRADIVEPREHERERVKMSTYAWKCVLSAQFMAGCVCKCVCGGVYRTAVGDKGTHWLMPAWFDRVCRD